MTVYPSVPLPIYPRLIWIEHRFSGSALPPSRSLKTNHLTLIKVGRALTSEAMFDNLFPPPPNVHQSARFELRLVTFICATNNL